MSEAIRAHITGVVFQVVAKPGDAVQEGDPVIILESMKMEIPVLATDAGTVAEILVKEEDVVAEGQALVLLDT